MPLDRIFDLFVGHTTYICWGRQPRRVKCGQKRRRNGRFFKPLIAGPELSVLRLPIGDSLPGFLLGKSLKQHPSHPGSGHGQPVFGQNQSWKSCVYVLFITGRNRKPKQRSQTQEPKSKSKQTLGYVPTWKKTTMRRTQKPKPIS